MIEYDLVLIGITLIICVLIGVFEKLCLLNNLLNKFRNNFNQYNTNKPFIALQSQVVEDLSPTEI